MERNFGYTLGRTQEENERDYQDLLRRLEGQEKESPTTISPSIVTPKQALPITPNPSATNLLFWTIPGVSYRGQKGNVDFLKGLLDGGGLKTQDEWATYSEQARTAGNFYTPDYPLLYATLKRAHDIRNDSTHKQSVEEMRTKLKGLSRENWLMTLTIIAYAPKGKDTIIHNFGLRDKYDLTEKFVGADGKLPAGSPETLYQKLLGTSDNLGTIKNVFNWMTDTDSVYIWRVNSKPEKLDERVVGFGAISGWANFYCGGSPTISGASLGVRFCAEGARLRKNGGSK